MQHTELLHRFFDEGLDEPLEDVLFGQMALDPELRREFLAHLKLHSIVQEDMAGITTPSHVSHALFTSLGMAPEVTVPPSALARMRQGTAMTLLGLRSLVVEHRRYLYTAVFSAIATSVILLGVMGVYSSTDSVTDATATGALAVEAGPGTEIRARTPAPRAGSNATAEQTFSATGDGGSEAGLAVVASPSRPEMKQTSARDVSVTLAGVAGSGAGSAIFGRSDLTINADRSALGDYAVSPAVEPVRETSSQRTLGDALPHSLPVNSVRTASDHLQERAMQAVFDAEEVAIAETPPHDAPWMFSQPRPYSSVLSNLVFELRKYYGRSFPDIDLPHNSHKVFENMAISVIYKTTEHHAFGFEYGRESFGREFQRTDVSSQSSLTFDPSYEQVYEPPPQWVAGPQREHRMLDLFGAVWKLSLPEYGVFDIVYPYMRSFVGATKLGPLGKVRAGLEMYPSNYSALNIGVEGGMLRYTVDGMVYYTTRLNFTFGVAIGF
ncbi:MAG: hypothetical protein KFH87_09300 [Bacteroidetes bacterium]|nr:hypothetical protein [Bacteroidota bacterium]